MENPIKMDDLGVPPFSETSKFICNITMMSIKHHLWFCKPHRDQLLEAINFQAFFWFQKKTTYTCIYIFAYV